MHIDLSGKVAIVTGGARGIGRGVAVALAREGVRTVVADIGEADLAALAGEFRACGWAGKQLVCDVRDSARIREVVAEVAGAYGRIDILVNNAGVAGGGPVDTLAEDRWNQNVDVNLTGTFRMCKAVIPQMKAQRGGRILNAASFAAVIPGFGGAAYAASKAGVHYFTKVLAGELGPWDITVNCYAPGMIPTDMNHFADLPPEQQETLLDSLSLRRWGREEEIAHLICFLASDQASYITGAMIEISGGKFAIQRPRAAYDHYAREASDVSPV